MWKQITDLLGSVVSSATSGTTLYLMLAAVLVSGGTTGYLVYKVEHAQIIEQKSDNKLLADANLSSQATISALKRERDIDLDSCQKQISVIRGEQQEFINIDNQGKETSHETSTSDDAVLDYLNQRLFPVH